MIYLDYAATSPLLLEVKQAMLKVMNDCVGNASALHTPGHKAHMLIERARAEVAQLINADPNEIIFTSGGSESNNTITNIFAGQPVAVSTTEHASVLESARTRCHCLKLPVDKTGKIKERDLLKVFEGRTEKTSSKFPKLVSIMLANNELGTIQDIKHLARLAHAHGALFHTDATQALGKIPVDVKALGVDYMTISAHKIGGPIGIGALYIKKGSPFKPLVIGGHQEYGKRAGTYATANIVGFGVASRYAYEHNTPAIYTTKIAPLRNELAHRILTEIPFSDVNGIGNSFFENAKQGPGWDLEVSEPRKDGRERTSSRKNLSSILLLPNILNVSFQAAEGESIQLYLDAEANIAISTGSACASGDGQPSHVLMATTNNAEVSHSSIRFSLGLDTTKQDVDKVMQTLPGIINRLQQISTIQTKGDL